MSFEDREAIVATVEETYALMGRALNTDIPGRLAESAVRPEAMEQITQAIIDPYVTDAEMLPLFQPAYYDLLESVLAFHDELLGQAGEQYDAPLAAVGLTGNGRALKVGGFRRSLGRALSGIPGIRWVKKAFQWGNIILGSLGSIPVIGTVADSIQELKESIEAQGDEDHGG
jgi:hypothetical protein